MGIGTRNAGTAGEMLIRTRLLNRGWNVASTQVDVGDDLMVFRRAGTDLSRIQVKTGVAEERGYGYSTQFSIGKEKIRTPVHPPLHFVFVVDVGAEWGPVLDIPQGELHDLVANEQMGSETDNAQILYVRYHRGDEGIEKVVCSDSELTEYLDDLSSWEPIDAES